MSTTLEALFNKLFENMQKVFVSALALFLVFGTSLSAYASVTPAVVEQSAAPGEMIEVTKRVETPEIAPKLDFLLLIDLSGSYGNDLANIRSIDDGLFDDISASVSDSRFAVASFIDYPTLPWGVSTDYPFNLDQDFTSDKSAWTGAIDALTLGSGYDTPESQYAGLKGSAESASWRDDATKVIAITTDASFHVPSDSGGTYPGPSREETLAALNAENIKVIAIKAPGATAQMDDVADETGGSVVTTSSDSSEIADAILEGLGNLPVTVTHEVVGCDPLSVSLFPAQVTVTGGEDAVFQELIQVPLEVDEGTNVSCQVVFSDENGNELGVQDISIDIPDTTPPVVMCEPSVNPSGKKIPPAGDQSPGENEDGFYRILAFDNVDWDDVEIYVNGFGPYESGDTLKITEAPGADPKELPIGGSKDAVTAHLLLNSDAVLSVTDRAGNEAEATCYVPPMPK